jgi:hypothetical protein
MTHISQNCKSRNKQLKDFEPRPNDCFIVSEDHSSDIHKEDILLFAEESNGSTMFLINLSTVKVLLIPACQSIKVRPLHSIEINWSL